MRALLIALLLVVSATVSAAGPLYDRTPSRKVFYYIVDTAGNILGGPFTSHIVCNDMAERMEKMYNTGQLFCRLMEPR